MLLCCSQTSFGSLLPLAPTPQAPSAELGERFELAQDICGSLSHVHATARGRVSACASLSLPGCMTQKQLWVCTALSERL